MCSFGTVPTVDDTFGKCQKCPTAKSRIEIFTKIGDPRKLSGDPWVGKHWNKRWFGLVAYEEKVVAANRNIVWRHGICFAPFEAKYLPQKAYPAVNVNKNIVMLLMKNALSPYDTMLWRRRTGAVQNVLRRGALDLLAWRKAICK